MRGGGGASEVAVGAPGAQHARRPAMSHTWIAVDTEGYDLEDLEAPRRIGDTCPACARQVTLVERELVRNLRVLGVPLVATARAGTAFQCERCGTCYEPPPAPSPAQSATRADQPVEGHDDAALAGLERKLRDADDEAALWRMRMDLATRKREPELAREARALIDRYAAVAETLRGEIAALRSARTGGTASPAAASPAAPVEDELEALRRRMAERAAAKPPPAPPEVPTAPATPEALAAPEAPAARSADDELAALKRRLLGDRPAPAPTTAPTPQAAVPSAPVSTSTPAAQAAPEEDEMAALKRKLRGK